MVCSLTKEQKQYNGAKTVFSTNGAETGHSHAKKKKTTTTKNLETDLINSTKIN